MLGLLGIVLSAGWLAVAYWWFDREIGLDNVSYVLLPEVIGQYVAGLLAPLILIWVLLGFLRAPRGLARLREELGTLREELAERTRREAARPRVEPPVEPRAPAPHLQESRAAERHPADPPPPPPLRRAAEPVAISVPPLQALASRPPAAAPILAPVATLAPPPANTAAAPPATGEGGATVTSLAQEVARTLGRLASEPAAAATQDAAAAQDDEFRQLTHKVGRDLNAICMDLSAVLCRKSARDEALKAYNRGHKEAFHVLVRDYLSRHEPAEIMTRLTQADAQSLLHTYAMKFASLIDEAARRDASGAQEQALRSGAMGQLYDEVQRHTQVARAASRP